MEPLYQGSITDVHGIRVGQTENKKAATGMTVVLAGHDGAVIAADVRGAAPGTRETDLCRPENTVERANAVALCGGSAFGLAGADGVMRWLEQNGYGVDMGVCRVPIVPAAVVFDLLEGDCHVRPDAAMGMEACKNVSKDVLQGAHGAGRGATVGKLVPGAKAMHGGIGTASIKLPNGVTVGAIAVVNACGDIFDPHTGKLIGCGVMPDGSRIPVESMIYGSTAGVIAPRIQETTGQNTTIAVIATDAVLTKSQAQRLATCAHDGYARAIRPVHTNMDGDTIFAMATGRVQADVNQFQLQAAAAEVMARAIVNGVVMGQQQ